MKIQYWPVVKGFMHYIGYIMGFGIALSFRLNSKMHSIVISMRLWLRVPLVLSLGRRTVKL